MIENDAFYGERRKYLDGEELHDHRPTTVPEFVPVREEIVAALRFWVGWYVRNWWWEWVGGVAVGREDIFILRRLGCIRAVLDEELFNKEYDDEVEQKRKRTSALEWKAMTLETLTPDEQEQLDALRIRIHCGPNPIEEPTSE